MFQRQIVLYLLIVLGLNALVLGAVGTSGWLEAEGGQWLTGAVLALIAVIPAIAAAISGGPAAGALPRPVIWPGGIGRVLAIAAAVWAVVAVCHAIEAALGFSEVDWALTQLQKSLPSPEDVNMAAPAPPIFLLISGMLISAVLGVVLAAPFFLATEYGWRAFFLPRVAGGRLGPRSYVVAGMFWGLSLAPLGFSGMFETFHPWSAAVRGVIMAVILTVILGEIFRRTENIGLTAVVLGSYAAQTGGMFQFLFPVSVPPWAGAIGIVDIAVWGVVAVAVSLLPRGRGPNQEVKA